MEARTARRLAALVVALGVLVAGCGDVDDASPGHTPTDDLVDGLLTAEDLGEGWTSTEPPEFDGVIRDAMRAEGGVADICENRWDTRTVVVVDGPVVVAIALNETLSGEPVFSQAELDDIVTTAVEKLR